MCGWLVSVLLSRLVVQTFCCWQLAVANKDQRKEAKMVAVILTTGEAARRADFSTQHIRDLVRAGKLSAMRTERGQFLFEASEIERFIRERESAKAAANTDRKQ
jgi:excisionase family DNA binding protein